MSEAQFEELNKACPVNSEEFKWKIMLAPFMNAIHTNSSLIEAYRRAKIPYIFRMMLAYHRIDEVIPIINAMTLRHKNVSDFFVLDYGCGVADMGMAFAVCGFKVAICDIKGGNLDFAEWRFKRRGLPVEVISVDEDNYYPHFNHNFDVILCGDVFEHLRSPSKALENLCNSLNSQGFLFTTTLYKTGAYIGGDHLPEAVFEWQSGYFQQVINKYLVDVTGNYPISRGNLLQKREVVGK